MLAEAERDARLTRVERINKRLKAALALMAGLTLVSIGLGAAPQKAVVKSVKAHSVYAMDSGGSDVVRIGVPDGGSAGAINLCNGAGDIKLSVVAGASPQVAVVAKDEGSMVAFTAFDKQAIVDVTDGKSDNDASLLSDADHCGELDIGYGSQRIHAYASSAGETAIEATSKDGDKNQWVLSDTSDGQVSALFFAKGGNERIAVRADGRSEPSIAEFGPSADLGFMVAVDKECGPILELLHGKEKDGSGEPAQRSAFMCLDGKGALLVYGPNDMYCGVTANDGSEGGATE